MAGDKREEKKKGASFVNFGGQGFTVALVVGVELMAKARKIELIDLDTILEALCQFSILGVDT